MDQTRPHRSAGTRPDNRLDDRPGIPASPARTGAAAEGLQTARSPSTADDPHRPLLRRALQGWRWEDVDLLRYKQEGSAPFKDVTRQVLFAQAAGGAEWRYFEVAPGGWSTLERHEHTHSVMILRGRGRCLVGAQVHDVAEHDLIEVAPRTWHQFRAAADAPLGFLCLVSRERDRPQLPSASELAALRALPEVARFLDGADLAPAGPARPAPVLHPHTDPDA